MHSNLSLYYLNQMGITPWVSRDIRPAYKLIIIRDKVLNDKASSLLQHIINSLPVPKTELKLMDPEEFKSSNINHNTLILSLVDSNIPEGDFSFKGFSLDFLLKNPVYKKKVFVQLNEIKRLIA